MKVNNVYNFKGKFQMRRITGIISHKVCPIYSITRMCEPGDFIEQMPNRLSVNQLILF